ncbi:MAG TPA: hypothetical protein PLP27_10200 [Crocinitomicaceae bacterium]|nr:hypothetical protein [Crocinitomicaceae bacterium]
MNKQTTYNIILFAGIMSIILLLVFRKEPKPVYPVTPVHTIEKRIESKEADIHQHFTQINLDKKIIDIISKEIVGLRKQLDSVKAMKDTLLIVQIQDTLINVLTLENKHLRNVITNQDSIIVAQRYIINSKDTIIAVANHELKKVKRQRNWSLAANGVLTGLLILK